MNPKEIPDLQIPFTKPRHVGYCLSCYRNNVPVYSIPVDATTEALLRVLNRPNVISGEALTKAEFASVFPYIVGTIELCWHEDLEFVIEGQNLPSDWEDR